MRKFNVRIEDPHFHEIHHALGCPWPESIMRETSRNHFALEPQSADVERMRQSPHWAESAEKFGMVYFHVTEDGKRALLEYLRTQVEIPARYEITYRDFEGSSVVTAKSRSAARYIAYLEADTGGSFMEFVTFIKSVRLYSRACIPAAAQ